MMMENLSNTDMNQVFEHLAHIKKVYPSENLYTQTLDRLQNRNTISLFWVGTIACIWVIFFATELYFASYKKDTPNKDVSVLIHKTNNILYNE